MSYRNPFILSENAFLWIYNGRTGDLKKYGNVRICIRRNIFTGKPIKQEIATAIKDDFTNRSVFSEPYKVNYYPKFREFLVWSNEDEDEKIRKLILETIVEKSLNNIEKCTKTISGDLEVLSHVDLLID